MKAPIAVTSAAFLLALTACGGDDPDTEADPEVDEAAEAAVGSEQDSEEIAEAEEQIEETLASEVRGCATDIENQEATLPCSSTVYPQGAFFAYFEEVEGYPIPEEHKPDNLPAECEDMGRELYELAEYGTADDEAEIDALMDDLQTECGDMPF